jgi:hypothetical protein
LAKEENLLKTSREAKGAVEEKQKFEIETKLNKNKTQIQQEYIAIMVRWVQNASKAIQSMQRDGKILPCLLTKHRKKKLKCNVYSQAALAKFLATRRNIFVLSV